MAVRPVRRQVSYQWRLREIMASRGLFNAADLEPLLAERGITLSSVQVWRLVTQVPERLSLPVLAALCDILEATPADLIATSVETAAPAVRQAAGGVVDPEARRPRRATLKPAP
jgi:DNA-binding Xre family transcriptional regulator